MKSGLNSFFFSKPNSLSIKKICSTCNVAWSPQVYQTVWEVGLCSGLILNTLEACADGNETALAATSRQTPVLCFVVRLRPGLQLLVRKCLRVTAACSAKSHFILLMDGWTDGCLVKAALSGSFYGASE